MSLGWGLVAIVGLALISVLTRGFFLMSNREWPMPAWLSQALRFAPLAALAAVIAPELVMSDGRLISTWQDPRLFAAAAAAAFFFWKRNILGTIVVGMAVLWSIKLGLGW